MCEEFVKFPIGMKVKVVADYEDLEPDPPWVGATGIVCKHNTFDRNITIFVTSGNVYPEDGDLAWFAPSELEVLES